jgi:hypothetical protein
MVDAIILVVVKFVLLRSPATDKHLVFMERFHARRGLLIHKYLIQGQQSQLSGCNETFSTHHRHLEIDIDNPAPPPVRNEVDDHAELLMQPCKCKRSHSEGMGHS